MGRGKLIVLCGIDGSGKATQADLLINWLIQAGYRVKPEDFPRYHEYSSVFVIRYLNGEYGSAEEVGPYRASLFYALDRYAASFEMEPWLDQGGIIVSNRYVSANKGHQLGKIRDEAGRQRFLKWLNHLEYEMLGIPKEDLNILLHVPPEVGQDRVGDKDPRECTAKKRDLHETDLQHLQNAAAAYLYVAEREDWQVINCTKQGVQLKKEEVHEQILEIVLGLLQP